MNTFQNNKGFSLLELIVAVGVLGMIMMSLQVVLGQSLSTHAETREKLDLVSQARFSVDRIALMVTETGYIETPVQGGTAESLVIEERIMDVYNNSTHAYDKTGDGILDADNDGTGAVNDHITNDPVDKISIRLDKTDADNWKLVEELPDYGTAALTDTMTQRILCEHVTLFRVTRGSSSEQNLIKIELDLGKGPNLVSLTTRSVAGKFLIL